MNGLEAAVFAVALAGFAMGSVGVVVSRKAVHMIAWLVVAAASVAVFLALLGYDYLAVFHVVIYTGTAVTLLGIIVMLAGSLEEPRPHRPGALLLAFMAAAALEAPLLLYSGTVPGPRGVAGIRMVAEQLSRCWLCTLLMVIAIATVLVEAVAIARRERPRG